MKTIRQIGRGGFGNVDLIEDQHGQQFARKTFSVNQPPGFPPDLTDNVKKRFIREANVQAAIVHNNIMPILWHELGNSPPSFVMPLALSSLSDDIVIDKTLGGNQLSAIMDILAGLEELHSMGITHRDLKPQNVLRLSSPNGDRYVIGDFGLMSIKDTQLSVLTQTGMRMGSDFYTAPEIVANLRMASPRSDIYSVGCILHDLFGVDIRIPCSEINESGYCSDIIRACTRRDPNRRFQTVADLREAIISLGGVGAVASEPQINDMINLLLSGSQINAQDWDMIADKAEHSYPSTDAKMLLGQLSLARISEAVAKSPHAACRLGVVYSRWVQESAFDFGSCDGIANRLEVFLTTNDLSCQSEVLLALLFMGTSHNRWYVERKFASYCGAGMSLGLARRVAIEMRVLGQRACLAISHLEYSINVNRAVLHPVIAGTLQQVC